MSIKCEKQNSIDFLYSADIRINEISHNGFNKEGKEKVIKSRLYFTIELGKSGKIIYKDGKVILELPNDLNKELVSEIKEFYKYPLHVTARYGDINTIRRLLDSRVNVNETLKYQLDENVIQDTKRTALHEACFYGNIGVAELLIKHGAKVNIVSDIGSPLHCASYANSSVVNLLLKHGANPWIKNHFGATPLHVALENKNYIIASKLIDEVEEKKKKEYVNTHDNSGYTPLYLIARLSKIDENHKKLIELLIRNGADLYLKPRSESKDPFFNSESIIEIAKKSGKTEFIKPVKSLELIEADDLEKVNQLIEEGADPQFKNIDGKTALNYATNPEVISALIKAVPKRERNSYINKNDKNGDTVLHYLAHRIPAEKEDGKYSKTAEILLENGANPYVKNKDQLDSLEVAINCKNCHFEECIWSFKKHHRQLNYVMVACAVVAGLTLGPLIAYFTGATSLIPFYFAAAVFIGSAVIGALVGYGVAKLYEKVSEEKMKNPEVNTCTVLKNVLTEFFKGQAIPEPA